MIRKAACKSAKTNSRDDLLVLFKIENKILEDEEI